MHSSSCTRTILILAIVAALAIHSVSAASYSYEVTEPNFGGAEVQRAKMPASSDGPLCYWNSTYWISHKKTKEFTCGYLDSADVSLSWYFFGTPNSFWFTYSLDCADPCYKGACITDKTHDASGTIPISGQKRMDEEGELLRRAASEELPGAPPGRDSNSPEPMFPLSILLRQISSEAREGRITQEQKRAVKARFLALGGDEKEEEAEEETAKKKTAKEKATDHGQSHVSIPLLLRQLSSARQANLISDGAKVRLKDLVLSGGKREAETVARVLTRAHSTEKEREDRKKEKERERGRQRTTAHSKREFSAKGGRTEVDEGGEEEEEEEEEEGEGEEDEWADELIALESIFGKEDMEKVTPRMIRVRIRSSMTSPSSIWLVVLAPANYPAAAEFFVESPAYLSRQQIDEMYASVRAERAKLLGEVMVYEMTLLLSDMLDRYEKERKENSAKAALLVKEAERKKQKQRQQAAAAGVVDWWDSDEDEGGGVLHAPVAFTSSDSKVDREDVFVEMRDVSTSPSSYVGNLSTIVSRLPRHIVVENIENIMRPDLAWRFCNYQAFLERKYCDTKHRAARLAKYTKACVGFHGTSASSVSSIVRSGLLVPGKANHLSIVSGSRYGVGIYLSPSAEFALHYAGDSGKLLVCAALPGQAWKITLADEAHRDLSGAKVQPGFDSHKDADGEQLILFHEGQVLPVYCVHYRKKRRGEAADAKFAAGEGLSSDRAQLNPQRGDDRLERKLKKEFLTQKARQFLPFGFGPAGANFTVEAIAGVSDDDEEWGEFRRQKMDMYQKAREADSDRISAFRRKGEDEEEEDRKREAKPFHYVPWKYTPQGENKGKGGQWEQRKYVPPPKLSAKALRRMF